MQNIRRYTHHNIPLRKSKVYTVRMMKDKTQNAKIIDILIAIPYFLKSRRLLNEGGLAMLDMMTVSTKGQITLPVDLRTEYGLKAGDKVFGEKTSEGYLIRQPKKGLLEYAGFIKVEKIDPEAEEIAIQEAAAARCWGAKQYYRNAGKVRCLFPLHHAG
jgi:AbrB family looped-hinge helix DNA binding protein